MATRRQRRVSELIHRELSMLLMREVRDPRLAGITLTEVRVTPDLQIARVYYTILGDAEEVEAAAVALQSAGGYLRTQLAAQVRLRLVPELVFQLDQSAEHGRRIDELLAQIADDSEPEDESDAG
ncbi:MAG: 30S ribosome-binding factor RbfA [Anaerolineae bacterium]|nr:30S ribosome-binding factor RbfA [Anaerolineae bacterium]